MAAYKNLQLEDFRALAMSKQLAIAKNAIDVMYYHQSSYVTIAHPLVYDVLNRNDRSLSDSVTSYLKRKLMKPVNGFYPYPYFMKVHANEKKELLYRQPVLNILKEQHFDLSKTVSINLCGANTGVDSSGNIKHLPYSSYSSWIASGGKKNLYWPLTCDTHDYNANLIGYEAGLLPRIYYSLWKDKIKELLYKCSVIDTCEYIFLEFDTTSKVKTIAPDIISTLDMLSSIKKPWVFVVNSCFGLLANDEKDECCLKKCTAIEIMEYIFCDRPELAKRLMTRDEQQFIFSQTRDEGNDIAGMAMVAFAFSSKER